MLEECEYAHHRHAEEKAEKESDDESKWIHDFLLVFSNFSHNILILLKIKFMLRVLASSDSTLRDALVSTLSLEKKEDTSHVVTYRKWEWIFVYFAHPITPEDMTWIAESFFPDRVYLPYFGYSIDVMHEIGDVIVPNVFLSYDLSLKDSDITKENRDTFSKNPRFLEIFAEQKDYYVEDFGLSVGGIVVDQAPEVPSDELSGKMMLAYEGDVYAREILAWSVDAVIREENPTLILVGIAHGKKNSRYPDTAGDVLTARNILTTIRLMEEE